MSTVNLIGWGGLGPIDRVAWRRKRYNPSRRVTPEMVMTILDGYMSSYEIIDALKLEYDLAERTNYYLKSVRNTLSELKADKVVQWKWRTDGDGKTFKVWGKR